MAIGIFSNLLNPVSVECDDKSSGQAKTSLIFRYLNDEITSSNVSHRMRDDRETVMKIVFEMQIFIK